MAHDLDRVPLLRPAPPSLRGGGQGMEDLEGPPLDTDAVDDDNQLTRTCRICRTEDVNLHLVAPCACRGSIGLVHLECLGEWIQTCTTLNRAWDVCEICHERYRVEYKARPFCTWNRPRFDRSEFTRLIWVTISLLLGIPYVFFYVPLTLVDLINTPSDPEHEGSGIIQGIIWFLMVLMVAACWIILGVRSIDFLRRLILKWRNQNMDLVPLPTCGVPPSRPSSPPPPAPPPELERDLYNADRGEPPGHQGGQPLVAGPALL